jgi:hypothetical protein
LSAFSIILINIDRWKVLWFVFAFPVENVAIDAVFALTGHKRAPKKRDGTIHKLTGNVHPGR